LAVTDASESNAGRTNDKPEAQAKSHGSHLPDETSGLDSLSSLKSYFSDRGREHALPPFSDWLRGRAHAILSDEAGEPADLFKFAKGWLNEKLLFGPAANVFALALKKYSGGRDKFSNRVRQQQALATYKDEEVPPQRRFEAALAILENVKPLSAGGDLSVDAVLADEAESWALRGAVYRRQFDLDGDMGKLHQALGCYRLADERDSEQGPLLFEGYGALNAAFLLDTLAFRFESIGSGPILERAAGDARKESATLRDKVIDRLDQRLSHDEQAKVEWLCETMAGACLARGLSRWTEERAGPNGGEALLEKARFWTERAVAVERADWKVETTHAQWLRVAYLNEPMAAATGLLDAYWHAAAQVINVIRTQHKTRGVALVGFEMARIARLGKVGLALSGGGFRASFYHIGVLARLAEADVLRHVDVLSTVSGGSIVGAHYYLLLRELLTRESNPSRDDYVKLVHTLQTQFSAGVGENLRMRGLSNLWAAVKLLVIPSYTRSNRMAELYDEHFYSPRLKPPKPVRMDELHIKPKGEGDGFNPRFCNWRLAARVPALLINATCLNTGHSWHFTANWMGEPPELIGATVDKNERLRRVAYSATPYQSLTLGFAVAASSCVPGLFEPLQLPGLYPGRQVRLVDGGVHDNQGVDALIGQGCDFILCSDASGQIGDENTPANGPVSTPTRSMSILMKRVREGEHADLETRVVAMEAGRNLFFVHLKSELPADDVDWVRCDDPAPRKPRTPASYGVDNQIQRYVSEIRTDLDAFSEVEASALMASGYLMACAELESSVKRVASRRGNGAFGALDVRADRGRWEFLKLEDKMALPPDANDIVRADLCRQLFAGRSLFFRSAMLAPRWTRVVAALAVIVLLGAAVVAACGHFNEIVPWLLGGSWLVNHGAAAVFVLAILVASAWPWFRVWCFESFFALFGLIGSNLYFASGLNRLFLRRGSLERLLNLK
jgi:predicted acylesterase/phospholipase RssA